jgi:hypothetical protein
MWVTGMGTQVPIGYGHESKECHPHGWYKDWYEYFLKLWV